MRLPNAEGARVTRDKLKGYLLAHTHPIGRSKARFFRELGFDESNVQAFEQELITLARIEEVAETVPSPHGTKYVVDGVVRTPSGKAVKLRTIWIVEKGEDRPRFVTAYPI